jgi:hypothetical protein
MNRSVVAVKRCVERIGIMSEKTFNEELLNKIKVAAQGYEKEFGTTNCTKIMTEKLGQFYSLADPEQYKAFIEAGGHVKRLNTVAYKGLDLLPDSFCSYGRRAAATVDNADKIKGFLFGIILEKSLPVA